ncbi:unnamed protein product [Symbiodinium sp. CCMP2592]|nr:unnamed protein product [Symbiodinium sp. CCMP2592]
MDIRVQAILSSLWPAARRPLAPFLVLGVDILDALDLASCEEASPPATWEPEPGVAQELDGPRESRVDDQDDFLWGHPVLEPHLMMWIRKTRAISSSRQAPDRSPWKVFSGGTVCCYRAGRGSQTVSGEKEDGFREC